MRLGRLVYFSARSSQKSTYRQTASKRPFDSWKINWSVPFENRDSPSVAYRICQLVNRSREARPNFGPEILLLVLSQLRSVQECAIALDRSRATSRDLFELRTNLDKRFRKTIG